MFIAAIFLIAKKWKEPKCPSVDGWINKNGIFINTMDYYLALKKNGILIHATEFMNFEKIF